MSPSEGRTPSSTLADLNIPLDLRASQQLFQASVKALKLILIDAVFVIRRVQRVPKTLKECPSLSMRLDGLELATESTRKFSRYQ